MKYFTPMVIILALLNTAFSVSIVMIHNELVTGWWANLVIAALLLCVGWYYDTRPVEIVEEEPTQSMPQPEPKPDPLWFGVDERL